MNSTLRAVVFWFVIVLSAFLLWQVVRSGATGVKVPEVRYSQFLSETESDNVADVAISRNVVNGHLHDSSQFRVIVPSSQEGMLQILHQHKVDIVVRDDGGGDPVSKMLNFAPILLLAVLWFFMIRQLKRGQAQSQNPVNRIEPR
jgi:ATP-dependent Zn protease